MKKYYVNKNAQSNGDHEVHDEYCHRLPLPENRIYLGKLYSCEKAVEKAKEYFNKVNGCYYCSRPCHTS